MPSVSECELEFKGSGVYFCITVTWSNGPEDPDGPAKDVGNTPPHATSDSGAQGTADAQPKLDKGEGNHTSRESGGAL